MIRGEECVLARPEGGSSDSYRVEAGRVVESTIRHPPACARDNLYLRNVSDLPEFRPACDALIRMAIDNLDVGSLRALHPPEPAALLKRNGSNLASVLRDLGSYSPNRKEAVEEYMVVVVPGLAGADVCTIGPSLALQFHYAAPSSGGAPRRFFANGMSDGTLRALEALVALFQGDDDERSTGSPSLVGIEEPESALHPGAMGALVEALSDASERVQVLVTSHSADLLDSDAIRESSILAVASRHGRTRIGPLDRAGRSALHKRLFTAGELLRMDQLRPEPDSDSTSPGQASPCGGDL